MPLPSSAVPAPRAPRPVQLTRVMRGEPEMLAGARARFGDVFRLHFERRPWVYLAHPDAIREVFRASPRVLHAGDANEILRPSLGSHSVLLLDEEEHLRQRKLLLPPFHGERLQAQRERIARVAAEQVARMPPDRPFALRAHTQAIALEVILQVVLGVAPSGPWHERLAGPFLRFLDWFADTRNLLLPTILGPEHPLVARAQRRVSAPVDRELYALIAERRAAGDAEDREDVLAMLLLARDDEGRPMRDEELRDELVTLLVAGHETTATSLAWAFERLTRHPAALRRLEDEAAAGARATYAQAVAKETLRLRPVLMNVLRTVREPVEIAGYAFEPGEVLAPSIWLVQRRPDLWGPDAEAFRPERWLEDDVPTAAWIPFGGGTRRCIGASFALLEMELVLHAIAGAVHLEPAGGEERPVARFITMSPERGGEVRLTGRPAPAREAGEPLVAAR